MNHYLLSIIQPGETPPPAEDLEPIMREVGRFIDSLRAADALVISGGLEPPSRAVVVRTGAGKAVRTAGPFIESHEIVGGLCIIRAPDPDAALLWAEKAARATTLPIEVRAFQGEPAA